MILKLSKTAENPEGAEELQEIGKYADADGKKGEEKSGNQIFSGRIETALRLFFA